MSRYAEPMARLIEELKKLPGVGTKSAQRFAFHILRSSDEDAVALAEAVQGLKASLRLCSVCNNITDVDSCVYCTSATRNQRLVCVVEEPTNIAAIEKTKHFNGVFHVLHGTISPLHGIGPDQLLHVHRVGVGGVLGGGRRPQNALRRGALAGEELPALAGKRLLVVLIGELCVGDGELALPAR